MLHFKSLTIPERLSQALKVGKPISGQDSVFIVPTTKVLIHQLHQDANWAGIGIFDEQGRKLDFHSFRVTFASALARAGVHIKIAQQLLRHRDIKMTVTVYTKFDPEDVGAAVEKLPAPKTSANNPQLLREG